MPESLRLQLWSWNYEPEPTAMGPIATMWSRAMRDRGHDVEVFAAHPHYPGPLWGQRLRPYREVRDGIAVRRLPLWIGHTTTAKRILEELTYAASAALAMTVSGKPDAIVCVSPAFLALAPMTVNARLRKVPWMLWLQDIFPDAAATTGLLGDGLAVRGARALEARAYRAADRIVVISETFEENLLQKNVPARKLVRIPNPATRGFARGPARRGDEHPPRLLYAGNIGFSQGLAEFVRAFEAAEAWRDLRLVVAGAGERAEAVRGEVRSDGVELLGLVGEERLDAELDRAALGLVSQRGDIVEFNVPSKLMTLMARGLPILASVAPSSEVARVVTRSGAGWVADSARPDAAVALAREVVRNPDELARRGAAAFDFACEHFSEEVFVRRFEDAIEGLIPRAADRVPAPTGERPAP